MKNRVLVSTFLSVIFFAIGCAQVQVKAPKEPIKVDITMRLDVYQHITKDIDDIENIVSGKEGAKPKDGMKLNFLMTNAYAQEGPAPEVEEAALRRRDRKDELASWESKGAIGENRLGLVEAKAGPAPEGLIADENSDRIIIYKALSQKNGVPVEDIQKIYAKRLQDDAPGGTPIEAMNVSGEYGWKIK